MYPEAQPTPHAELGQYPIRIVVAGSRGFDDYRLFSETMHEYTSSAQFPLETPMIFITGKAKTGADAMIIRWCKEFGFPWSEFPADWENIEVPGAVVRIRRDGTKYNFIAGYMRNEEMAKVGTNLIVFWDNISGGTRDMLKRGVKHMGRDKVQTILVNVD